MECEHCGSGTGVLYGWHADVWCRSCIEASPLEMVGTLDDAPADRPTDPDYARPFILQD